MGDMGKSSTAARKREMQMHDAGYQTGRREAYINYDSWLRAQQAAGNTNSPLHVYADLAIRQVIYGNPLGKRPDDETGTKHETGEKEKT